MGDPPFEQLDFLYMPSRDAARELTFYHSQIVLNPERAFEIVVLDRPVQDSG